MTEPPLNGETNKELVYSLIPFMSFLPDAFVSSSAAEQNETKNIMNEIKRTTRQYVFDIAFAIPTKILMSH